MAGVDRASLMKRTDSHLFVYYFTSFLSFSLRIGCGTKVKPKVSGKEKKTRRKRIVFTQKAHCCLFQVIFDHLLTSSLAGGGRESFAFLTRLRF
ncbi:hypothetical protein AVEN_209259-1 [Araneus ventricosus]|uniref:Uncharacterized protein n=1 Tax=Araneus ventricosus TaxID=182803 RepID=A0A4Y2LBY8_ARAVE|nr:hypothetical protein AVEN_66933-1 [Araneus ventricosus]GBN12241.1 hypothetical protein AVEN_209259-1 [Araneus ventricosus]